MTIDLHFKYLFVVDNSGKSVAATAKDVQLLFKEPTDSKCYKKCYILQYSNVVNSQGQQFGDTTATATARSR